MASLNGNKQELTSEQLQIIKDEISNDPQAKGYEGKTTGGIEQLLNEKPLANNPTPQGEIDGPPVSPERILVDAPITLDEIKLAQADADGRVAWEMIMNLTEIDLNSDLADKCLISLGTSGVLKAPKVQAIRDLGKIPDPNWQAQVLEENRTEELLGPGYMVEGEDIRTVQALEVAKA